MVKKQFFVFGIVQGVGFRYFTWREATKIGVKGFVRNRQDGSVEVVATGTEEQITALHNWLMQGPRTATVEHVIAQCYDGSEVFEGFNVLH